jgi:hypothetical protein
MRQMQGALIDIDDALILKKLQWSLVPYPFALTYQSTSSFFKRITNSRPDYSENNLPNDR